MDEQNSSESYALKIADESYSWYRSRAIRCRRAFRMSESALLLATAAIPVAALAIEDNGLPTALLGCAAALLVGMRSIFHWQENYIRFSAAREAVENQRRRFHVGLPPYDDAAARSGYLVAAVTEIEQTEMRAWFTIAVSRPRPAEDPNATA